MKRIFTFLCSLLLFAASASSVDFYPKTPTSDREITYVSTTEYEMVEVNDKCSAVSLYGMYSNSLQNYNGALLFNKDVLTIDSLFLNCSNLGGVNLPGKVQSIGKSAFEGCTNLETAIFYAPKIERNAFKECSSLNGVNLYYVKTIEQNAFNGCSGLVYVQNPYATEICDSAFFGCSGLERSLSNASSKYVAFYNSKKIGTRAFYGCTSLKEFTIPDSLKETGTNVFEGCTNLTTISVRTEVPFDLEKNKMFNGIDISQLSVSFDRYLSTEATYVYATTPVWKDFKNLNELNVVANGYCGTEDKETNLRWYVMKKADDTYSLKIFGDGKMADFADQYSVPWYNYMNLSNKLTDIEIVGNVTNIGANAFRGSHITSFNFPANLTGIGQYAFFGSEIAAVDLSGCVLTGIGEKAFSGCTKINFVSLPSCLSQIGSQAFSSIQSANVTMRSIPTFGEYTVFNNATISLELTDSDRPFIAETLAYSPAISSVTYHRTLAKGSWGTIMLPFVPASTGNLEFFELKEMTKADGGSLTFQKVETVQAGVPYLFRNLSDDAEFTLTASTSDLTLTATPQTASGFALTGSFQAVKLDGKTNENLYYLKDNKFWHATGNINVSPFRAYIEGTGGAKAQSFMLIIDDRDNITSVPGIIDQSGTIDETVAIYDLNGNLLSTPKKGQVNIIRTRSGKTVKKMF